MSDSQLPNKSDGSARNFEIHRAVKMKEEKLVQDTIILQKVNKAHREGFKQRFPGQIEHCLRLVMERLQVGLDKRGEVDLSNLSTWTLMPAEIKDLADAAKALHDIRNDLK